MPATSKVSNEQVRRAIEEWGGNVSAAAAALGMRPKSLRERIARLGIDLESIRATRTDPHDPSRPVPARTDTGTTGPLARFDPSGSYGRKSAPGPFPSGAPVPTLTRMQAAVKDTDAPDDEIPVRTSSAPPDPIRVKPEYQERVRQAKVKLIARYLRDFKGQGIFDQFFEERFDSWLQSKLEPAPAPAAPRASKRKPDEGSR